MRTKTLPTKLIASNFRCVRSPVVFTERSCRRTFLLAAMGSLAEVSAPQAAVLPLPSQRLTVALPARLSLYHLPLTLAEQLGYFRQAGVVVNWLPHESGSKAAASVVQGQADVAVGAFEHLFGLQQRGLNFQGFAQLGRTPQVCLGVATRHALPMRSVMDLKGARVGITGLDSCTHWMACQWLLQNGLLPEDVVFVEVGSSTQVLEALRAGVIDALCNPDPVMHWLEQKNEIRLVGEARSLTSTRKVMGGSVPGACMMARTEWLQRQSDGVQALTNGVVHALKWLQTAGLTDILKTVPTHHWLGDRAVYLGAFEKLRESYAVDAEISGDAVVNAWRAFSRLPGSSSGVRPALERTFTNVFAAKAKQRFGV
jgi:NitT/TauT family transport system substrate-binding protein